MIEPCRSSRVLRQKCPNGLREECMGLIDKSVTAFFPDARCVLGASVPLLTAIAVLSLVPGCATEYPYRPATQMEQSGDMIGAYHYLANVARKHPNDEVLLERVFQDGHRHYDQYVAGESNIPANDLWQRLAYLKAYPRTGLPFDSEVDTRIRDREDAIKQVETRIAEAETAKDRRHTLAILKELAPYAPYSPKIQFVKDACLKQFVMHNVTRIFVHERHQVTDSGAKTVRTSAA